MRLWVQYSVVCFASAALIVLTWFPERSQVHKSSSACDSLKHWRVPTNPGIYIASSARHFRQTREHPPPPFARVEKEWGDQLPGKSLLLSSPPCTHGHIQKTWGDTIQSAKVILKFLEHFGLSQNVFFLLKSKWMYEFLPQSPSGHSPPLCPCICATHPFPLSELFDDRSYLSGTFPAL